MRKIDTLMASSFFFFLFCDKHKTSTPEAFDNVFIPMEWYYYKFYIHSLERRVENVLYLWQR